MPPPSKRKRQLRESIACARDTYKQLKSDQEATTSAESLPTVTVEAIPPSSSQQDISSESTDQDDPTFDPQQELDENPSLKMEQFLEDWVVSLSREDKISLGLFLSYNLRNVLNFTATRAAEYAAVMMGKSDRTIRQWHSDFVEHSEIPDNEQGRYQRQGILWSSETLNKKATKYIRENCNVKGQPNLTSGGFCLWVNEDLLPNECLEPGFPRRISVETARQWMHHLGFEVLSSKKGAYFDGHEREDVVEDRKKFLTKMIEVGFLHPDHAPTPEAQRAFPSDVSLASSAVRDKCVIIFHDESIFNANDDQTVQWGVKGEGMLRPKSKGSGIMVSDFIDERNGYLCLTTEEFEEAVKQDITVTQSSRRTLEYGESREGYWSSDKFMVQMEVAVKIANIRYPKTDGWNVVWVFDHSSCHTAMAHDALDVAKMNVKPGGKQAVMRDTMWAGKPQKMTFALGVPKGMKQVLEERGINTITLKADQMRQILAAHDDFKNEKPRLIQFMEGKGQTALYLPKFHPELNPIERVWCQAKRYSKAHCKYTLPSLRNTVHPALDSVTLENIVNFNRKARDYMCAYLEGFSAGPKLEDHVKKVYKSHRKVGLHS